MNKHLAEFNAQLREHRALIAANIRDYEKLKRKISDEVSQQLYKDLKRRV